jgi:nicotinamidase-related amidase
MQDRYAGDIGDYVKMALLRRLEQRGGCRALGVAWYRVPNQGGNEDGRYTNYLFDPDYWSAFCPATFAALKRVVDEDRSVEHLQATGLLERTRFHAHRLDARKHAHGSRREKRGNDWFAGVLKALHECDLVFVDPDNGIAANGFDPEGAESHKSITLEELSALARDRRALVIYHHQTRNKGGHLAEIDALHELLRAAKLEPAGSLRAHPWSARLFIFVNATDELARVAQDFAEHWRGEVDWFPANESAAARTLPKRRRRKRR